MIKYVITKESFQIEAKIIRSSKDKNDAIFDAYYELSDHSPHTILTFATEEEAKEAWKKFEQPTTVQYYSHIVPFYEGTCYELLKEEYDEEDDEEDDLIDFESLASTFPTFPDETPTKFFTIKKETEEKIETFSSLEEAEEAIKRYEENDEIDGTYEDDAYDIIDEDEISYC